MDFVSYTLFKQEPLYIYLQNPVLLITQYTVQDCTILLYCTNELYNYTVLYLTKFLHSTTDHTQIKRKKEKTKLRADAYCRVFNKFWVPFCRKCLLPLPNPPAQEIRAAIGRQKAASVPIAIDCTHLILPITKPREGRQYIAKKPPQFFSNTLSQSLLFF